MRQERNNIFAGIDLLLVLFYVILVGFGWFNIYAASFDENDLSLVSFSTKYGKQSIWIILAVPLIIFILFFNSEFYERFSSILYIIALISLVLLFPLGKNINGATSWFSFGGVTLQPSEFAKAFTALALAKLMSDRQYNLKLIKNQIKAFLIIFIPAVLILLQRDAGSALIYLSFFFVLNREGLTIRYIIFGSISLILFLLTIYFGLKIMFYMAFGIITVIAIYFIYRGGKRYFRFNWHLIALTYIIASSFIYISNFVYQEVLEPHQKDRFDIILGKKIDNRGIGYNSYQAEQTISSGEFTGKGFLQGDKTKGGFVPVQETDYIFSVVGEEWGFLGTSIVILLYMGLLFRIIYLAENQTNKFSRIYGYGVASILFFHVLINIGMVIGLIPTIGIPLPFFSYGGSSLWGFTLLLFIFIRLDAHKTYDW